MKICEWCGCRIWPWQGRIRYEDGALYHSGCLRRKLKAGVVSALVHGVANVANTFLER